MLRSLEINNFRTFSRLVINRLGRVNLIVGKNNVGKTTLLEALRLYGSIWPRSTVASILHERNEVVRSAEGKTLLLLHSLFHGRDVREGDAITIRQLPVADNEAEFRATARFESEVIDRVDNESRRLYPPAVWFNLEVTWAGRKFTLFADGSAAYEMASKSPKLPEFPPDPPCVRGIGVQEEMENSIANWWDAFSLTEAEGRILDALQVITPIQRVSFVGDPRSDAGRMAKVRVGGIPEPVALATLGDGVVRMFQIAVALEYAAAQSKANSDADPALENVFPLLIDEIESGIHYTLHADLWRFILHTARLLDVQVFATTHSLDCLRGFAEAVAENEENDGLVIRLEKTEGHEATRAVVLDRNDLPIVVRDSIEVR